MKSRALCLIACALMALCMNSCENDDDDSKESPETTTDPSTELLGVWVGPAGAGQGQTTVQLTSYKLGSMEGSGEDDDEFESFDMTSCGTVTWINGDQRRIAVAVYDPPLPRLYLMPTAFPPLSTHWATDKWDVDYDGESLSGAGTKFRIEGRRRVTDGGYDVRLTRQQ
jgi:hypothetical protein